MMGIRRAVVLSVSLGGTLLLVAGILRTSSRDALINAARRGDNRSVEQLLSDGGNPETRDRYGLTALMAAAERGHVRTVELLITKGADVNAKSNDGATALNLAAENTHPSVVRVLLRHGATVDNGGSIGFTPLMAAAMKGDVESVRLLLAKRADANAIDYRQRSVLVYANDGGNAVIRALIQRAAAAD